MTLDTGPRSSLKVRGSGVQMLYSHCVLCDWFCVQLSFCTAVMRRPSMVCECSPAVHTPHTQHEKCPYQQPAMLSAGFWGLCLRVVAQVSEYKFPSVSHCKWRGLCIESSTLLCLPVFKTF